MITTLHFTQTGRYFCDGLAQIHPGLRTVQIGGGLQPGEIGCDSCPRFIKCGMSHVTALSVEINDIAAVEALCKQMGWTFKRDQKNFKWYGRWVNDYSSADAAYKQGIDTKDYGKCDHAIGVPGTDWEIGLVKNPKTGGYKLAYDFYGSKGAPLKAAIGEDGGKFLQGYGVAKAKLIAKKNGYYVKTSTLPNGTIKLTVRGM